MPGSVGDQRRQDNRPDAFGDNEPEQDLQHRDEQHEHEELPKLDADIEREQRREQVRPGELQRLAQSEREAEPVNQPEPESDQPSTLEAALDLAPDDVLERH